MRLTRLTSGVRLLEYDLLQTCSLNHIAVTIVNRVSAIAVDIVVVLVTWLRTMRYTREATRIGVNVSLSGTLLRDGKYTFRSMYSIKLIPMQEACFLCALDHDCCKDVVLIMNSYSALLVRNIAQIATNTLVSLIFLAMFLPLMICAP